LTEAKQHLERARERQREYANKSRRHVEFEVGDWSEVDRSVQSYQEKKGTKIGSK
jgi:hypothetical protein